MAPGQTAELTLRREPPIGVMREPQWHEQLVPLPGGTWSLLLYTDGLIEGRSRPGGPRPYGAERVIERTSLLNVPVDEADVDRLLADVQHANGEPMADDIVIVAMSPVAITSHGRIPDRLHPPVRG
jgi:serine phosphatase RsbU (regulator of sigma subunit)